MMGYQLLASETVFRGRVFDVHQDRVRLPDGAEVRLDVVAHHGAVTIIPLDDEGRMWFVRQYRHPAGRELLEFPAGVLNAGEDPQTAAQREIREEIGMRAAELRPIGEFFLAPGYSTEYMHVFLATGLSPDPLDMDEDERIELEKIPWRQVEQLARQGGLGDAKSLAALLLAQPFLA
jgi:ADP-ribose pyrophosphatase